jgi:hypothetical protein
VYSTSVVVKDRFCVVYAAKQAMFVAAVFVIVSVSVVSFVVNEIPVPAARVSVSVAVSATMLV